MVGSLGKHKGHCTKTSAPIRCNQCVSKNTEINRLQNLCSSLQRQISTLKSTSREMIDASCGSDNEMLSNKIAFADNNIVTRSERSIHSIDDDTSACETSVVQSPCPTILSVTTTTDFSCNTEPTNADSRSCGTDDTNLVVCNNGTDSVITQPFYEHHQSIFQSFDLSQLDSDTLYTHSFKNRSVAHYGDCAYTYSGGDHPAKPIFENNYLHSVVIPSIKKQFPGLQFNSVMVTRYSDGGQYIPFHSDNESCITPESAIMTISLGDTRNLVFRSKVGQKMDVSIPLTHGDALLMSRFSQDFFEHSIPKDFTRKLRVSITLRQISEATPLLNNSQSSISEPTHPLTYSALVSFGLEQSPEQHSVQSTPENHVNLTSESSHSNCERKSTTVYISSSMFSHLDAKRLCSKSQDAYVFSYRGATAKNMHDRFKTDKRHSEIDPQTVDRIFLLCGTNDVDNIVDSPRHMRNKLLNHPKQDNLEALTDTFNHIEDFVKHLHQWAPHAAIRLVKVLPRESRVRNEVITKINSYTDGLVGKFDYVKQSEIEKDRFLFANKNGFRKSGFFSDNGSDNVHLNHNGIIRLANHLKYTAHNC